MELILFKMQANNKQKLTHIYLTGGMLFSVLAIGIIGFMMLGFTPSEAVYQTIITIATVGFEEVHVPYGQDGIEDLLAVEVPGHDSELEHEQPDPIHVPRGG